MQMKSTVKIISLAAVALFLSILFYACSKDNSATTSVPSGSQDLSLYLTDAPARFNEVLVDIQSVQVLVDTCSNNSNFFHQDSCNVWKSLNVTPGIYNLLTLQNGADTMFAGATVPAGNILFIKLTLGPNDSLVKDSVTYPLMLRDSSVVLVDVSRNRWDQFEPRRFRLWLDFDVSRSIINVHDNQFYLDPFIRVFTVSITGSVSGDIWPGSALPVVTVYNSSDTAYAIPSWGGFFEVRGLTPGTYSAFINASNGYADTTIMGINVTAGNEVNIGNIKLHQ